MKEYYCKHCGRKLDKKYPNMLCQKHYEQWIEYGFFLDENPRNKEDENEILLKYDIAEIILYDDILFEEKNKVIIDCEDIEKIRGYYWESKKSCIITSHKGKTILLPNLIMNTDNKIEYIDGDYLNNKKENLKIIEKKNKKIKNPYIINKKNKNKVIVEFIGESHNGVVGSSILCSYPVKNGEYEKILIEMGMVQKNGALREEYVINKEVVDRVLGCGELKGVFISHAHL